MNEIRLPQHVVNRFERRWTAGFAQMLEGWRPQHARFSPDRMRRPAPIAADMAATGGISKAADGPKTPRQPGQSLASSRTRAIALGLIQHERKT
jgi:hypothetical protein